MRAQADSPILRPQQGPAGGGPAAPVPDPAAPADGSGGGDLAERVQELSGEALDWFLANGVDGVGLVLTAGFALLGLWHGLWWQVIRFAGLLGAVLAARGLSPDLAVWIGERWTRMDPLIVTGSAWLVVFLAGLFLAVLVGRLGKRLLDALELSALDRLGGLLAGLATGLLLHAAGVAVLLQLAPPDWSRSHIRGSQSDALVQLLGDRARVLFDQTTALALEARRDDELR